jgi:hypothetical protein
MNRLAIPVAIAIAIALAFSATALAQDAYQSSDPNADTQGVDTSSPVDRQAEDTYEKNAQPPVPAAPLAPDRPADMRPKDITGSADVQAAETYRSNVSPTVPPAPYGRTSATIRYRTLHYGSRHHRHRHVAGDPPIVDHRADHAIVEPTSTRITVPPSG